MKRLFLSIAATIITLPGMAAVHLYVENADPVLVSSKIYATCYDDSTASRTIRWFTEDDRGTLQEEASLVNQSEVSLDFNGNVTTAFNNADQITRTIECRSINEANGNYRNQGAEVEYVSGTFALNVQDNSGFVDPNIAFAPTCDGNFYSPDGQTVVDVGGRQSWALNGRSLPNVAGMAQPNLSAEVNNRSRIKAGPQYISCEVANSFNEHGVEVYAARAFMIAPKTWTHRYDVSQGASKFVRVNALFNATYTNLNGKLVNPVPAGLVEEDQRGYDLDDEDLAKNGVAKMVRTFEFNTYTCGEAKSPKNFGVKWTIRSGNSSSVLVQTRAPNGYLPDNVDHGIDVSTSSAKKRRVALQTLDHQNQSLSIYSSSNSLAAAALSTASDFEISCEMYGLFKLNGVLTEALYPNSAGALSAMLPDVTRSLPSGV